VLLVEIMDCVTDGTADVIVAPDETVAVFGAVVKVVPVLG